MSPSDRMAQLYFQAPGSLFVAFYDSKFYGGGFLTCPSTGLLFHIHAFNEKGKTMRSKEVFKPKFGATYEFLNLIPMLDMAVYIQDKS
jgi:hypothetical protein